MAELKYLVKSEISPCADCTIELSFDGVKFLVNLKSPSNDTFRLADSLTGAIGKLHEYNQAAIRGFEIDIDNIEARLRSAYDVLNGEVRK